MKVASLSLRLFVLLGVLLCFLSPCWAQDAVPLPATQEQMAKLIPYGQDVAGFKGRGTRFTLVPDQGRDDGVQKLEKHWGRGLRHKPSEIKTPADRMFANQPADYITIEVLMFSSPARAHTWPDGRNHGAEILGNKLPNGRSFGHDFLTNASGSAMLFTQGRAGVLIDVGGTQCPEEFAAALAEAVGRGISYVLCTNTDLTDATPPTKLLLGNAASAKPALVVDGVT